MGSDKRISLPGLTTLKMAKNTDPNPVGVKKNLITLFHFF